jgi:hypothetical protein
MLPGFPTKSLVPKYSSVLSIALKAIYTALKSAILYFNEELASKQIAPGILHDRKGWHMSGFS